ncbi:aminopeptidase P family protein [Pseudomonas chlororaphis]|uniref:aminopeptidase P family protein n=1 Tax=Pseudomonas chlororaphis TaxID=587753 RepID=UPI0006A62475|nr:aminopeptidase P family protein [Pseudomonas chlororaphis]AZD03538.1 Xaa-Pro aminopeptidase [Pseudomonas chlororaphis subsp. chlororaphis]MBM0285938.1 aminopeptidase P family protein [Pseudomonas chlororaphis]MDO1503626.1 aminopeptidase P family protein [Pseudomonas chlororaphis]ORM47065.1 Xaa-Pro aminopeptidase [Pseudomonas chlororaphis subsp. chlororaphis]WDG96047.1 aminopeptidase P family protein [Pseudomonas chlororaphis]
MSTQPLTNGVVPQRLARTRELMNREGIHALLVPSADPHLSEYLPGYWQGRQWLSGFHGSVGTLIVTADFAGVWADSRYWEQATKELKGSGIELVKLLPGQPGPLDWLAEQTPEGGVVAVDGAVMALASARTLGNKLQECGARLRTDIDLLNEVWSDRPSLPDQPIYQHLPPQATVGRVEKLGKLRETLKERGVDWHFIATLDDIAWLFNLRGGDVSFNPVFVSFALISQQQATLFVALSKVDDALRAVLEQDGITLRDYSEVAAALSAISDGASLLVDPARVTVGLLDNLGNGVKLLEGLNPTTLAKSRKSLADAEHIRQAMEQDGAALCEFFAWLESAWGRERITELTIDEHLTAARTRRPGYVSLSFNTIAAFNANGAMPHYHATEEEHAVIEGDGLLLIDSGGQYLGGTTDITRMVPVGTPSAEQKSDCTRVLKGVIALSRAQFPRGILSPLLDAIARAPIWAEGVDYGHGTGHGVGYFLNVHEGPQVIAYQAAPAPQTAMQPGMITSIEPGTYRPGRWGVRIENLAMNREAGTSEFGEFLKFETLTLCPIDSRCLEPSLLTQDEREWLNAYHAEVRRRLSPLLQGAALEWLNTRTATL